MTYATLYTYIDNNVDDISNYIYYLYACIKMPAFELIIFNDNNSLVFRNFSILSIPNYDIIYSLKCMDCQDY